MLYSIDATVVHHTKDENCVSSDVTIQIPTFYLDSEVQGIVDEAHAVEIARGIILPFEMQYESATVNILAGPMD